MKCLGSVNSVSYVPYTLLLIRIEEFTTVWLVYGVFIYLWTLWEILVELWVFKFIVYFLSLNIGDIKIVKKKKKMIFSFYLMKSDDILKYINDLDVLKSWKIKF